MIVCAGAYVNNLFLLLSLKLFLEKITIVNKIYWIVVSMAVVLGLPNISVYAQDDDSIVQLKAYACRRLMKLNDSDKKGAIMFFHGYVSGRKKASTADVSVLSEVTDKVIEHCIDNPNDSLLSVFEKYR